MEQFHGGHPALNGGAGAYIHENRGLYVAVNRLQFATPGTALLCKNPEHSFLFSMQTPEQGAAFFNIRERLKVLLDWMVFFVPTGMENQHRSNW
jgi:hypothetical protein